jgi:hypothetical protein
LSVKTLDLIRSMVVKMPYSEDTNGVPNTDAAFRRARLMLVLMLSSPDYLINR